MKEIALHGINGGVALVDDEDFDRLNKYKWYQNKDGYIGRNLNTLEIIEMNMSGAVLPKYIRLHREVLNHPEYQIDHRDGNRCNNQKSNLRKSTQSQNIANTFKKSGTSSKYKGVSWHKNELKWYASIKVNNRSRHLGAFINEIDAAKAYNKAAIEYFGEFARINIIENG